MQAHPAPLVRQAPHRWRQEAAAPLHPPTPAPQCPLAPRNTHPTPPTSPLGWQPRRLDDAGHMVVFVHNLQPAAAPTAPDWPFRLLRPRPAVCCSLPSPLALALAVATPWPGLAALLLPVWPSGHSFCQQDLAARPHDVRGPRVDRRAAGGLGYKHLAAPASTLGTCLSRRRKEQAPRQQAVRRADGRAGRAAGLERAQLHDSTRVDECHEVWERRVGAHTRGTHPTNH